MNSYPRGYLWRDAARDFLCACVIALVLIFIGAAVMGVPGCRSAVPVTVLQNNFNCVATSLNNDGSLEFHQCTRDGNSPVEVKPVTTGPTGTGDDKLEVPIKAPLNVRN